jgi:hypothetical protein
MVKKNHKKKICPHGGNHSSKRRSESESYNQQTKNYNQYEKIKTKSDIKSEKKAVEVKNKEKLIPRLTKAKITAKADEVKAIGKTLKESRVTKEKQLKVASTDSLPPHFANTCNISSLSYTHIIFSICIFTFDTLISMFSSFISDPLDHHFQTFTIGDLSDCKVLCLSQRITSVQAKATVKAFANPDPVRLFKVPQTRPDPCYRNLHWNPIVPKHLPSGRARKSENDLYNDVICIQLPRVL